MENKHPVVKYTHYSLFQLSNQFHINIIYVHQGGIREREGGGLRYQLTKIHLIKNINQSLYCIVVGSYQHVHNCTTRRQYINIYHGTVTVKRQYVIFFIRFVAHKDFNKIYSLSYSEILRNILFIKWKVKVFTKKTFLNVGLLQPS